MVEIQSIPPTHDNHVWDALNPRIGEDLQAVTGYHRNNYEPRMRDYVPARYSAQEDAELVDQTIIDQTIIDQISERKIEERY